VEEEAGIAQGTVFMNRRFIDNQGRDDKMQDIYVLARRKNTELRDAWF